MYPWIRVVSWGFRPRSAGSWPNGPKLMDNGSVSTSSGLGCAKSGSLPKLARMPDWQTLVRDLSPPLSAEMAWPAAVLLRIDGKHATRFEVTEVAALTGDVVDDVLDRAGASTGCSSMAAACRPAGTGFAKPAGHTLALTVSSATAGAARVRRPRSACGSIDAAGRVGQGG
jgi:hypothetical protein